VRCHACAFNQGQGVQLCAATRVSGGACVRHARGARAQPTHHPWPTPTHQLQGTHEHERDVPAFQASRALPQQALQGHQARYLGDVAGQQRRVHVLVPAAQARLPRLDARGACRCCCCCCLALPPLGSRPALPPDEHARRLLMLQLLLLLHMLALQRCRLLVRELLLLQLQLALAPGPPLLLLRLLHATHLVHLLLLLLLLH